VGWSGTPVVRGLRTADLDTGTCGRQAAGAPPGVSLPGGRPVFYPQVIVAVQALTDEVTPSVIHSWAATLCTSPLEGHPQCFHRISTGVRYATLTVAGHLPRLRRRGPPEITGANCPERSNRTRTMRLRGFRRSRAQGQPGFENVRPSPRPASGSRESGRRGWLRRSLSVGQPSHPAASIHWSGRRGPHR
jgi:hypothetical protein